MATTQNPNVVIAKNLNHVPSPLSFFDFARVLAGERELIPEFQIGNVSISGDMQVTGSLFDDAVRNEVAALDQVDDFQVMQVDIRGKSSQPRIILSFQPGTRTLNCNYHHAPNDAAKKKIRAMLNEWIAQQNVPVRKEDPPAALPLQPLIVPLVAEKGVIIDCYKLIQPLGRGYSAAVWHAEVVGSAPGVNLSAGSHIAIKIYYRLMENSTDTVRVQREFHVATSIEHPNLVKVYDLVLSPSRPLHNFLVMELVRGRTLKSAIPARGMELRRVITIAQQIFSALGSLHVRDALHRDVKAANIMLTQEGDAEIAKLCDLGIVSVMGDPSLTGTSVFMGSKHSAPLEQMVGDEIDARTDVYAAGSVMFHCYKGQPMYFRTGPEGAIVRQMLSSPEKLTARTAETQDKALVDLINQCIAVDPADRPQSAAAVVERLAAITGVSQIAQ